MKRLLLVLAIAACHHAPARPAGTRRAVVAAGDAVDRVLLSGVLNPTAAVEIDAPTNSESPLKIRWLIEDGATVKAGDRVLEIDDTPFTGRLDENRKQLTSAQAQLKLLRRSNALSVANKKFAVRQAEIAREKIELHANLPTDLVKVREAEDNHFALQRAEADVAISRRDLATTSAQLAVEERLKEIDVEKLQRSIASTEAAISELTITAPRDGIVAIAKLASEGHNYSAGSSVERGQPVLSQPDLSKPMEVRADLIDVDDGRVALHASGTCTLDAYPADPIACTVVKIAPVAQPKEGHDSLRRAFGLTLALAKTDAARLRPGMSVKIELAHARTHGLVVPRLALIGHRVQLASGQLRDVTIAACDAQQCVIASGLAAGDVVTIGGTS